MFTTTEFLHKMAEIMGEFHDFEIATHVEGNRLRVYALGEYVFAFVVEGTEAGIEKPNGDRYDVGKPNEIFSSMTRTLRRWYRAKYVVATAPLPRIEVSYRDLSEDGGTWRQCETTIELVLSALVDAQDPPHRLRLDRTVTTAYDDMDPPYDDGHMHSYLGMRLPFRAGGDAHHHSGHLGVPVYARTPDGYIDITADHDRRHQRALGIKHRTRT